MLSAELTALGLQDVRQAGAGASFTGDLEAGYRACLHSRVANRVLMPLHAGPAPTPDALYERVREVDWAQHLDVDGSLAVDLFTAKSAITHSQYGALKVKDAVVDQFRDAVGRRPSVDRDTPDVRINVYLFRDRARIALDLSGSSLHRRGYRDDGGPAPIKENLAAALLLAADWPARVDAGEAFVDPLCGSGTLLIEAAMIACRRAPGLGRDYFGFVGWKGHDAALWERLLSEARAAERPSPVIIAGGDRDARAVEAARRHAATAGVAASVAIERLAIDERRPAALDGQASGLVLTNPPYGERLAAGDAFYADFGASLALHYSGWHCGIFTARAAPASAMRLALETRLEVRNGGIDCVYLEGRVPAWSRSAASAKQAPLPIPTGTGSESGLESRSESESGSESGTGTESDSGSAWAIATAASAVAPAHPSQGNPGLGSADGATALSAIDNRAIDITAFANRLAKNVRSLRGWLRQADIRAWRAYDAELPEFAVAIDVYDLEDDERHLVVQEYRAPATVNAALATARLDAVVDALPSLLETTPERVHVKIRERQSGSRQYERAETRAGVTGVLCEQGARYELNFSDYLDTGLFLDHRKVRRHIGDSLAGKRFLNLFAYTGAATVAAVVGGARESVSVDLSNRYCRWAERNLTLNGADSSAHQVVRRDVATWLAESTSHSRFDLILLDPPTFSNSTDTERDWDVQRDHAEMIDACLDHLETTGTLIFSNNFRRFRLDPDLQAGRLGDHRLHVEERSRWSLGRDFGRNPRIHRVWFIRHASHNPNMQPPTPSESRQ